MPGVDYHDLQVYQLATRLAQVCCEMALRWPSFARWSIGTQLTRASDSVGANIAEGAGRGTFADNRRFVHIARGSLYETQHWLRTARTRGLMTSEDIAAAAPLIKQLLPMLNAYLRGIGSHGSSRTRR